MGQDAHRETLRYVASLQSIFDFLKKKLQICQEHDMLDGSDWEYRKYFTMPQMMNSKAFMRRWSRSWTDIWTSTKESSQWIRSGRILFRCHTNNMKISNERWRVIKNSLSCFRPELHTIRKRTSCHWNKQNRFWKLLHARSDPIDDWPWQDVRQKLVSHIWSLYGTSGYGWWWYECGYCEGNEQ